MSFTNHKNDCDVPPNIVLLDQHGVIVATNTAWDRFAIENPDPEGNPPRNYQVGANYLAICCQSTGDYSEEAKAAHDGIRAVLNGSLPHFILEYSCHSPTEQRWFTMTVTPLNHGGRGAVVTHVNVTAQKNADKRQRIEHDLMAALAATTNLDDGLKLCLEAAIKVADLDSGGLYLIDRQTGSLQLRVHQGLSSVFIDTVSHFGPDSTQACFVAKSKPVFLNFSELPLALTEIELQEGLCATALIPVVHEGHPIGCLNVCSHTRHDITPTARIALEMIASSAAQAIARLHAQAALHESETGYKALFDEAVDGIMLMTEDARILRVNNAFARMHGYGNPKEIETVRLQDLLTTETAQLAPERLQGVLTGKSHTFEVEHYRKDGSIFPMSVTANCLKLGGKLRVLSFHRDITEQKRAAKLQALSSEVLSILNDPHAVSDATYRILQAIKRDTGIEAVGIRLREDNDFPFAVSEGFSKSFIQAENSLIALRPDGQFCLDEKGNPSLECTCGMILSGKTNVENPLFTPGGSAWTNDSSQVLNVAPNQDSRLHPRNRCIHESYRSVALIPIRVKQEIIGLLQLNDRRKGIFTLEMIRFLEGLAASFGVALLRLKEESAIRENQRHL